LRPTLVEIFHQLTILVRDLQDLWGLVHANHLATLVVIAFL
jgi:hypothetical protein